MEREGVDERDGLDAMTQRTAVGVHIYSGSFAVGMMRHYDYAGQLEEGPWGVDTFRLNYPDVYHPTELDDWDLDRFVRNTEVMFANPPCAPWSVIGSRQGAGDERFQFTHNCIDAAVEVQPDFFVLESVCRAWSAGNEFYLDRAQELRRRGYKITFLLTNVLLHGGCQWRERFHLIAHRWDLDLQEPARLEEPPITVGDTIKDLARTATWYEHGETDVLEDPELPNHCVRKPSPEEHAVFERLRAQDNYNEVVLELQAEGIDAKKGRLLAGRLHEDCVSRTMVDLGCVIHPTEPRLVTIREGLRLCGYPDSFRVAPSGNSTFGSEPTDVTQVVVPTMGDFFGDLFRRSKDRGRLVGPQQGGEYELIDWRKKARHLSPGRWLKTLRKRREKGAERHERDRVRS